MNADNTITGAQVPHEAQRTGHLTGARPGLGLLCWKNYNTFARALESYERAGLFDLVGETLVWFQEIDDEARALASRFGLPCDGSPDNRGILGGFKALAGAMTSDVLLLLENDLPLIEPQAEAARQIALATRAVRAGDVQVFRLRHTAEPGQKFNTLEQSRRYHGAGLAPLIRRTLRPGKARRLAGTSLYAEPLPELAFPDLVTRMPEGWLKISAACLPWTNQSIMVRRDFFLETIIAGAQARPSSRTVNGFPDIEKEWNTPRWRASGWTIGADTGLFTHLR